MKVVDEFAKVGLSLIFTQAGLSISLTRLQIIKSIKE